MSTKRWIGRALTACLVLVWNCSQNTTPTSTVQIKGQDISFSLSLPVTYNDSISNAIVIVSAPDMDTISQPLAINGSHVNGTITKIALGYNRHIEIKIFNLNNLMVYYGDDYSDIMSDKTIDVYIKLRHISGSINVTGVVSEEDKEYIQDTNTLSLYHFNESGTIKLLDETERWHGKLVSGTRCVGLFGGGVSFIPGQYATLDTIITDGMPNGTVETYFKFSTGFDTTGSYAIFGNDGARCLLIYKNGNLMFLKNHSDIFKHVSGAVFLEANKWYHIAGTWGSKGMRVFVNGKCIGSNQDSSVYQSSPRGKSENTFYIGNKTYAGMEGVGIHSTIGFNGTIDEIRISSVERY